jgi:hypothetical protein
VAQFEGGAFEPSGKDSIAAKNGTFSRSDAIQATN